MLFVRKRNKREKNENETISLLMNIIFQYYLLESICFLFPAVFFLHTIFPDFFKVGLSPSKKICFVFFDESPLKMMKNAFYLILKALFVLKIFKFLSKTFGHVGKTA